MSYVKVTPEIEMQICKDFKNPELKIKDIAEKYKLSKATISAIKTKNGFKVKYIVSEQIIINICKDLLQNLRTEEIARKYNLSISTILSIAKKNKLKRQRKVSDEVEKLICHEITNTNTLRQDIARKYNVCTATLLNIQKRNNIILKRCNDEKRNHSEPKDPNRRSGLLPINHKYFENIDSSDKAYFAGFIVGDAAITNKAIKIVLHEKDSQILKQFKECLKSSHKLTPYLILKSKNKPFYACRIVISCKSLCDDLAKHGITKNKSKELNFPTTISEHLLSDFIRGLHDSDGSWVFCDRKRTPGNIKPDSKFTICSSVKTFLLELQDFLIKKLNLKRTKIYSNKNNTCFSLDYAGNKQCKKLYDYIYSNKSSPKLERKFIKATEHFKKIGMIPK